VVTRVHASSPAALVGALRSPLHSAILTLLAVVLLPLAAADAAETVFGVGDPAAYLALSGLVAFDDRDDLWAWEWGSAEADGGVTARAGVRLGAPIAIELQGDWINLDEWEDNDNWVITVNFRVYPTLYEPLGLKGIFPDRLQPYLVAGVGTIGGTGDEGRRYQVKGAFRLGAGGDFYVTERLAVSFGYEWITGTGHWSDRDTRNLTLGLQFNF
jgi:hypothetical protein